MPAGGPQKERRNAQTVVEAQTVKGHQAFLSSLGVKGSLAQHPSRVGKAVSGGG